MANSYYDPEIFLLPHDLDKELIQQTLELFRFILGEYDGTLLTDEQVLEKLKDNQQIQQMYTDAIEKYRDPTKISIESIKEKLAEKGFLYLTEVFEVTDDNLRVLDAYLPLIEILKGTLPGLQLIFTILNIGFKITEWWEDPVNLEILSYILFVELVDQPVSTSIVRKVKKFSREYVYPLLTQLTYAVTYKFHGNNRVPQIGAVVYSRKAITIWQEFLWLIWAHDSAEENLWTDEVPWQDPISRKSFWQGNDSSPEMVWDENAEEPRPVNKWSSRSDIDDYNVWKKLVESDGDVDGELLEWWIEKINLLGKPENSWCTEDRTVKDPILTYWAPDKDPRDYDESKFNKDVLYRFTITASPASALVEINGVFSTTARVKEGTTVSWKVYETSGKYITKTGEVTITEDTDLTVVLDAVIPQYEISIVPSIQTAIVSLDSTRVKGIEPSFPYPDTIRTAENETVTWTVSAPGYISQSGSVVATENMVIPVNLVEIPYYTIRISTTPADATVRINGETVKSVRVPEGTKISYSVSATNYIEQSASLFAMKDETINVVLEKVKRTVTLKYTPSIATTLTTNVSSGRIISTNRTSDTTQATIIAEHGTVFTYKWTPTNTEYKAATGSITVDASKTETKELVYDPPFNWRCYRMYDSSESKWMYMYVPKNSVSVGTRMKVCYDAVISNSAAWGLYPCAYTQASTSSHLADMWWIWSIEQPRYFFTIDSVASDLSSVHLRARDEKGNWLSGDLKNLGTAAYYPAGNLK